MTPRGKSDPGWATLVAEWKATQARLRERMIVAPLEPLPRFVAGADCAFSADKKTIFAAAVVYDRETQRVIEIAHTARPAEFPYIPGFLSFREGPAVRQAIGALKHESGAILFDGQGFAHPRRCGIATFTTDLQHAISASRPDLETCTVAMTDHGHRYDYPAEVCFQINDQNIEEYARAADFLNAGRYDVVCLQHEFGIFGGDAGAHISRCSRG